MRPGGKRGDGRSHRTANIIDEPSDPLAATAVSVSLPIPAASSGGSATPLSLVRRKSMKHVPDARNGPQRSSMHIVPSEVEQLQQQLLQQATPDAEKLKREQEERIAKLRLDIKHNQHRIECDVPKANECETKLESLRVTIDALTQQNDELEKQHAAACAVLQTRIDSMTQKITAVQHETATMKRALSADTVADSDQLVVIAANLRANQIHNFVLQTRDRDFLALTEAETSELHLRVMPPPVPPPPGGAAGVAVEPPPVAPYSAPSAFKVVGTSVLRGQLQLAMAGVRDPALQRHVFGGYEGRRVPFGAVLTLHADRVDTRLLDHFAAEFQHEADQRVHEALTVGACRSSEGMAFPHPLNI